MHIPSSTNLYSFLFSSALIRLQLKYMVHTNTPVTPAQPLNDFEKWNNIEQILYDVYEILMNNFNYYCGEEIFAGDETGLLL